MKDFLILAAVLIVLVALALLVGDTHLVNLGSAS